jgi:urease accessory protein
MDRDAKRMRGAGPTLFCQVKHNVGIPEMVLHITQAYRAAAAKAAAAAEQPDTKRAKH